jgi:hypothetical protein
MDENYRRIKQGMTQEEVEALLGQATVVRSGHQGMLESVAVPPRLRKVDNVDLYEGRTYVGRIGKNWHRNIIRIAFRKGDGVLHAELFEEFSPTLPQKALDWINLKLGRHVTSGYFR